MIIRTCELCKKSSLVKLADATDYELDKELIYLVNQMNLEGDRYNYPKDAKLSDFSHSKKYMESLVMFKIIKDEREKRGIFTPPYLKESNEGSKP